MSDQKIFRIKKSQRIIMLVFSNLLPIAAAVFLFLINPYSLSEWKKFWGYLLNIVGLYCLAAFIICALLAFSTYRMWADKLVFTADTFERRCIPNFTERPGVVAYDDIIRVFGSSLGSIVIDVKDGKTYRIYPRNYEGGTEAVLDELRRHIPEERFDSELPVMLRCMRRGQTFLNVIIILLIVISNLTVFYKDIVDLIRRDVAWKTEIRAGLRESIRDFALTKEGSAWILVRDYSGELRDPTSYTVKHIRYGKEAESLQLPSKEDIFPDTYEGFTRPVTIELSSRDLPVLDFFDPEVKLYWTGEKWQWDSLYRANDEVSPVDSSQPFWGLLRDRGTIILDRPATGEQYPISIGEYEKDFRMDYKVTHDGWVVVVIFWEDWIFFHSFKEDLYPHVWYELSFNHDFLGRLVDYTVDSSGNFYVLFHHKRPLCEDGKAVIGIGKHNKEKGAWQMLAPSHPEDCDRVGGHDQIIIDKFDRVWMPVGEAVVVYEEAIWEERELLESEYQYYTEGNSGYYVGGDLSVGSDGRIWSLDSSGDALVWIDPGVDELEGTIWPLLGWLYKEWKIRMYIGFGSSGALLAILVIASFVRRRRRKDVETPGNDGRI